jgi:hypothetical protein
LARPSSFDTEYPEQAYKLCLLGATDKELADFFDVEERTVNRWKKKHPEFCQSLKRGKMDADADIADRLHQRARGFEYDKAVPIKLKEVLYENGKRVKETERVEVVMVHEVVPPDTTAGIFWLKNRRPQNWRDRQEVPPEEAAELARKLRDALRQMDGADGVDAAA